MFKSKMIRDPRRDHPNLLGVTVGFTLHTPKYWNCRKFDFDTGSLWIPPPLPETVKEARYEAWREHRDCKWPYLHRSYRGYAYWTGPKRRYTFWYMGHMQKWWKLFEVFEHNRYVKWWGGEDRDKLLNSIPTAEDSMPDLTREGLERLRETHRREAAEIRREMDEYRKMRESW